MEILAERTMINGIDVTAVGEVVEAIQADASKAKVGFAVTTRWMGGTASCSSVAGYTMAGEFVERAFEIAADEPVELLGANTAPNPQELLMAAVNACMTVGYVAGASLHGITLDNLEIEMKGELDLRGFLGLDEAVAPGYNEIDYVVRIVGNGTPEQYEAIHANVQRTSPNFFNLARPIRMNGRLVHA